MEKQYHKSNGKLIKHIRTKVCSFKGCKNVYKTPFRYSRSCGHHSSNPKGMARQCNIRKKIIGVLK